MDRVARSAILMALWAAGSLMTVGRAPAAPPRSRQQFARRLAQLRTSRFPVEEGAGSPAYFQKGMSERQVLALLGPPDDIVAPEDLERCPGRLSLQPGERLWAYGTDGHQSFPTLGWLILEGDEVRSV